MTVHASSDAEEQQCDDDNNRPSPKYRMAALDLDGTLLGPDHRLSDATVAYLRRLHEKGFIFSVATGRSPASTAEHVNRLNLSFANKPILGLPMICLNGAQGLYAYNTPETASVLNSEKKAEGENEPSPMFEMTELFHEPVPLDVTVETLKLAKKLGHVTNYYIGHDIYANSTTDQHFRLTKKYGKLCGIRHIYCNDDYKTAMNQGLPSKLLVLCDYKETEEVYQKLSEALNGEAHVIRGSPPWFVEVLNKGVCKGRGFQRVCEALGIGLQETIAFGDGDNDKEMLELAGKSFAMKNGRDLAKIVADEVTEWTNAEDGVIRTLQRLEDEGLLHFNTDTRTCRKLKLLVKSHI